MQAAAPAAPQPAVPRAGGRGQGTTGRQGGGVQANMGEEYDMALAPSDDGPQQPAAPRPQVWPRLNLTRTLRDGLQLLAVWQTVCTHTPCLDAHSARAYEGQG